MRALMTPRRARGPERPRTLKSVERRANAWVRKLASGRVSQAQADELKRWCKADPAHAQAFALARRRWEQLGQAGALAAARQPAATHRKSGRFDPGRRLVLGGMASAAAATAAVLHPPMALWPSARELGADYRTATGEQRRVVLADAVTVELNTRTSIALRPPAAEYAAGIELIAGEAAVDLGAGRRLFAVLAGAGRAVAHSGHYEVRRLERGVCVRCLQGQVRVVHQVGTVVLDSRAQVIYDNAVLGRVESFDPDLASAWREGLLRFVETPLGEVIEEINRYRPGRVVLVDSAMAARPVTGRFRLDALDVAIAQIRASFGLNARALPGGVLLLA